LAGGVEEVETVVAAVSVLAVERSLSVEEVEDVDDFDRIPVLELRESQSPFSFGSADDRSSDVCTGAAEARGMDQEGSRTRIFFTVLERIFSSSSEENES
jgi:hypothetical protein